MTPEAQAAILNRFPEVRWDRTAGDDTDPDAFRAVYGWVDRPGSVRADFVVILFTETAGELVTGYVTSSVTWSEEFGRRLFGEDLNHAPCVAVVDHYGDLVPGTVRSQRPVTLDARVLGQ